MKNLIKGLMLTLFTLINTSVYSQEINIFDRFEYELKELLDRDVIQFNDTTKSYFTSLETGYGNFEITAKVFPDDKQFTIVIVSADNDREYPIILFEDLVDTYFKDSFTRQDDSEVYQVNSFLPYPENFVTSVRGWSIKHSVLIELLEERNSGVRFMVIHYNTMFFDKFRYLIH